jgi:hypothetical protein
MMPNNSAGARLTTFVQQYYFSLGKIPDYVMVTQPDFETYCELASQLPVLEVDIPVLTCAFGSKLFSSPHQRPGHMITFNELPVAGSIK